MSVPKASVESLPNHVSGVVFAPTGDFVAARAPNHAKPPQRETARIAIKSGGKILFLNASDLLTVVAQGNYVLLQSDGSRYRVRESISVMAEKLKPYGFVRVHRSLLVNKSWVEEIRPCPDGKHLLRLRDGKQLMVTRSYRKSLTSLADLWL